jgi:hypothetical protein
MYSAVARAFSEEVCAKFGITRLKLLLTYKKAARIELNANNPGGTFILVPAEGGGTKPKLFAHCSVDELRQALAHQRSPDSNLPIPAEDRAVVDQCREAVVRRFPSVESIRVQLRTHEGKTVVDFKGIPVEKLDKLVEALTEQLYAMEEMHEEEVVVAAPQPA